MELNISVDGASGLSGNGTLNQKDSADQSQDGIITLREEKTDTREEIQLTPVKIELTQGKIELTQE